MKLKDIRSFFRDKGSIVALTGGPGFGKTQIAKHYALKFQKDYELIWWIDAQQDIPDQFEHLVVVLNSRLPGRDKIDPSSLSKKAVITRLTSLLKTKNIPFLFVFDNVKDYKQIQAYLPFTNHHLRQHIVITSRSINVWEDRIEIGKFQRTESLELIEKTLLKDKNGDMEELARSLSDYPLGLALAVSFIKSAPTTTIRKYLTLHMKRTLDDNKHQENKILDDYTYGAKAALDISLKAIGSKSKAALDVLFFMSLLNSKDILESYIESWLKLTKSSLTADEAIKFIYDQSLLEVRKSHQEALPNGAKIEELHYLSLHDLTHQLFNDSISVEDKTKLIDRATQVLNEIYSGPTEVFTKKILNQRAHLVHAQKLCENARKIGYTNSQLLQLKVCIFECLMGGVRDFKEAGIILDEIEKDLKEGYKIKPYHTALYYMNKAFYETSIPMFDPAITHMEKGLSILNTLKGYEEEKLRAITNLAQYHCNVGLMKKANTYIEAGKKISVNLNSELFNCLFLYVWALVLNNQGMYDEALRVIEKANSYPTLGSNYPTIDFYIVYQKAQALISLGRLEEASQAIDECEKKAKQFYQSTDNLMFSNLLLLKSLVFIRKNKNINNALKNLKKALEGYNVEYHGEDKHSGHGKIHLALGKAYALQKKYRRALREFNLSESVYKTLLKAQEIDDISDLYKELVILGVDLKDEALTNKYLKIHTKIFGLDHPRTKEIFHFLDKRNLTPS